MAQTQLLHIPINQIKENPNALRPVDKKNEEYIGLVDSVKARGVLNPINVRELKNNGEVIYGLIDGLQRLNASIDAGFTTIPAQVINMDEAEVMEAQIIANIHKVETKLVQYSKQLLRILSMNPTMTMSELADKLKKSHKWLSDRFSLAKLTPKIQELVDEGKLNLSNAYALAKLPEEEQVQYLDQAITTSPTPFLQLVSQRKKELQEAKRQGRAPKSAEFVPPEYLQKVSDIKEQMSNPDKIVALLKKENITDATSAVIMTLKWILHVDPVSAEQAKMKWEAEKAQKEADKLRKKNEQDQIKLQEAQKAQEAAQKQLETLKV